MVHVVANEIELRIVLGENAAILEGRQGPLQSETRERRGKRSNLGHESVRTARIAGLKCGDRREIGRIRAPHDVSIPLSVYRNTSDPVPILRPTTPQVGREDAPSPLPADLKNQHHLAST